MSKMLQKCVSYLRFAQDGCVPYYYCESTNATRLWKMNYVTRYGPTLFLIHFQELISFSIFDVESVVISGKEIWYTSSTKYASITTLLLA